jgi:respiratory burst oxidase
LALLLAGIFANTWWFLMLPTAVCILEKLRLLYQESTWKLQLLSVRLLPCNVLEVQVSKPPGWKCAPGMFAQMKIPGLSLLQWHSFTVTSAPEDAYIGLLIRSHGDWTCKVSAPLLDGAVVLIYALQTDWV